MKRLMLLTLLLAACSDPFASGSARLYTAVATGGEHSCAVSEAGEAYCWGRGVDGQLGNGTKENRSTPVQVIGDIAFEEISVGNNHSCALAVDGLAYCWGWNTYYERGNPTDQRPSEPVPVARAFRYRAITAGAHHNCALTLDSTAYCWGFNRFGQLGSGNENTGAVPDVVLGDIKFAGISAGAWHTCGWTEQGVGYCWGKNDQGQLGIGSDITAVNVPTLIAGPARFRQIDAGEAHTCGTGIDGTLWCWGSDAYGELGNGSVYIPGVPATTEPRPISPLLPAARFLYAGAYHSCAVTDEGRGSCWGRGQYGQLGIGSTSDNYVPQNLHLQPDVSHTSEYLRFTQIAPGGSTHVCGLADGSVYCWGTGNYGQLGVRESRFAPLPQRVAD